MFDIGASICLAFRPCFLEAIASTNGNSTICKTLVTQQSATIDTILLNLFLSEVNGFYSNTQMIIHSIIDAGIELSSILLHNGETPGKAGSTAKIS